MKGARIGYLLCHIGDRHGGEIQGSSILSLTTIISPHWVDETSSIVIKLYSPLFLVQTHSLITKPGEGGYSL